MAQPKPDEAVFCTWTHRAGLPPQLHERLGDLDQLLRDLILSANSTALLVAPYLSASGMRSIKDALAVAARKGAFIRIVTGALDANGGLNRRALAELVDGESGITIGSRLRVLCASSPLPELVHAKLIVVDGARGYLGSANLSRRGLEFNFEIGVSLNSYQAKTIVDLISFMEADGHLLSVWTA